MPPLTTSRFTRLARGLVAVAVVSVGALGGSVAPAGAGAPAGHTAAPVNLTQPTDEPPPTGPYVTDLVGTHTGDPLTPLPEKGKKAKREQRAQRLASCGGSQYGGGFNSRLGGGWTSLAIRTQACTGSSSVGSYGTSSTFYVSRETSGEFLCRGRSYGYGSSIWFKTSRGWVWSGGTANPRWNRSC